MSLAPRTGGRCFHGDAHGLQDLCGFLSELHSLDIDLFLHQQGIDTTTPAGKAMFQMMGVFAEFERAMIRERVNAGIARAKAVGKHCGRPFIDTKLEGRIREALATPGRPGLHKIAKQFGVGTGTVQRMAALPVNRSQTWRSFDHLGRSPVTTAARTC